MPKNYDKIHTDNINRYSRQVKQAYLDTINKVISIAQSLSLNANNEFYFRNYSEVNNAVNELILELNSNVKGITISGMNTEWEIANEKNDAITRELFGKKLADITSDIRAKYFSTNDAAKRAFIYRKENGLNLSDRIWRNTRQLKTELELALEVGIGKGRSAQSLSRDVRQYLNEPDRLYRRVKDANGVLRLSKAGKAYNPGQGVYRSSYKNAFRLTREETNQSYRRAEYEKRQSADYVVGILVETTPGWTPEIDKGGVNCGELAGKYPPTYNFRGNHIQCRCTSRSILKSEAELDKDLGSMLEGNEPSKKEESSNYVDGFQDFYKKYVEENKERFAKWSNPPIFMQNSK